ncbi:GLPGLI family protein [Ferruginibacter sp. SUN106]|uniref:GLPGLI family protein n=1 Tax=Ferruginibacter sp. SUN106 TaxID=2978348 RepID=UPI003D360025
MKYLLLVCFLYCSNNTKAQNTYRINYSHVKYFADSLKRNGVTDFKWSARLVYNDSISFYYILPDGSKKDKFEKKPVIGDKLIHHGLLFNARTKEAFNEVAWPKNNNFLVKSSPRQFSWVFSNNTKNILGHICTLAYSVNANNDTSMVWHTDELGKGFGPYDFFGLPGIALEVFDQQNDSHYIAEKIELTSVTLVFPKNAAIKYPPQKPQ